MSSLSILIFILTSSIHIVLCTELCKSKDWWYDIQSGECRVCSFCGEKSFIMEECSDFADTICVDLRELGREFHKSKEKGYIQFGSINRSTKRPKWHETEGADAIDIQRIDVPRANAAVSSKLNDEDDAWRPVLTMGTIIVCLIFLIGSATVLILRQLVSRNAENRKKIARARLFSRDRLNTTEYMNNLATLDRRLAMDEILEKRKKAIFEPHLLQENIYTDEVFVDISGLPRDLHDEHDYEELDHNRCLLRIQDQQ